MGEPALSPQRPLPLVSVLIPAYNAAATIGAAVRSALAQTYAGALEVIVADDGSEDGTAAVAEAAAVACLPLPPAPWPYAGLRSAIVLPSQGGPPRGPGAARNAARRAARGVWLCLLDADDVAAPERVHLQLEAASNAPAPTHTLIGSAVVREPADATPAYTAWANSLDPAQMLSHAWREVTLLQPTWFMAAALWDAVGGYDEIWTPPPPRGGDGLLSKPPKRLPLTAATATTSVAAFERPVAFPEDTLFFHRHLAAGGALLRVPQPLVTYTYSASSQSWRTSRAALLAVRVALFEECVLGLRGGAGKPAWRGGFTIWCAGRDGKAFYKALTDDGKARVRAFADIDPRKIGHCFPPPAANRARKSGSDKSGIKDAPLSTSEPKPAPVIHWRDITPPAVICVAVGDGRAERADDVRRNVRDAGLEDGDTAIFFV